MERTNFTTRPLRWLLLSAMALFFVGSASAQMACNDNIQVSLDPTADESCQAEITADMILEGDADPAATYTLQLLSGSNALLEEGATIIVDGTSLTGTAYAYLNQTLIVKVIDDATGNSCWGSASFEDKAAPIPNAAVDATISCEQSLDQVAGCTFADNCTPANQLTVELTNQTTTGDICDGDLTVTRTYVATDAAGNVSAPCTQTILYTRTEVDFPALDFELDCADYNDADAQGIDLTLPSHSTFVGDDGVYTGTGYPAGVDSEPCNYAYDYADQVLTSCGDNFKVVRTWTVLDWCTGDIVTEDAEGDDNVQIIKVIDDEGPVISGEDVNISANVAGAHPQPCTSQDFIAIPEVTDNCNEVVSVRIYTPAGEVNYITDNSGNVLGGTVPAPGLQIGTYVGNYQAEDACGNITNSPFAITVVDDIAPVTVCDQITDVTLSSDGLAVVYAATFDDGSHDNCGIESMSVRRMTDNCDIIGNTAFGPSVTFCCEDIVESPIMVVFQVTDYAGNSNTCMVEVHVEDKIAPITLTCPANEVIDCDTYLEDYAAAVAAGDYTSLEDFGGVATFYDNCAFDMTYDVTVNINTCSEGTITRAWTASDSNGSTSCTQVITVEHTNEWEVKFPADVNAVCTAGSLPAFGEPEVFFDECELIGTSYDDTQYDVVPDACYKIVREWSVINWCVFDPSADNDINDPLATPFSPRRYEAGSDGYVSYQQVIKVVDNVAPTFTIAEIDGCIINATASGEACMKDITLPFPTNMDDCSDEFEIDIDGDLGFFNDISGAVTITDVAPGDYTVYYNVTDECGNFTSEAVTINVTDCKKPTPYCVNGVIFEIMQTGMVEIWASDLDAGSFDNCPGDLKVYFNNNPALTNLTFDCTQLGENNVELWIEDAAGNKDYCITQVYVQNNMGACDDDDDGLVVSGAITTDEDVTVENVEVALNGAEVIVSNLDGTYTFNGVTAGSDVSLAPALDANPSNGVTTYDLVLISKHILGVTPLDTPYKMIAADANNSGTVTTSDMVELRKMILLINTEFTNNTSWRFVDAAYAFPNPSNPWAETFPEVANYNNVTVDMANANFVGVKVGDVNGSASANSGFAGAQERTNGNLVLTADNATVTTGETVTVEFTTSDLNVEGFQFTLNHSNLELVEIVEGVASAENFGIKANALTASWNGKATNEVLFTAVFTATADVTLSEVMSLNSRLTAAEAYNANGEAMDVNLEFNATAGFELFQNSPNPFNGVTTISFNLPTAAAATLTINDINGKVLSVVNVEGAKGYNSVQVSDLAASGVLYYTLESANFSATKKMVLVK